MDRKSDADFRQLWARYRRIMRWLMIATALPVIVAVILIARNEKIFAAQAYIMLASGAAFAMLMASIWLIWSYFRRK